MSDKEEEEQEPFNLRVSLHLQDTESTVCNRIGLYRSNAAAYYSQVVAEQL